MFSCIIVLLYSHIAIYSSMVAHCQIVEIWRHLATSVACVLRFIIARHMFIYDNFNILLSKSCSCIATPWYYTRTWWFEAILYIHYNNNISQQIIVLTLYIAKCATMVSRISWWNYTWVMRSKWWVKTRIFMSNGTLVTRVRT